MRGKRITSIDTAKGFGILLVVLTHINHVTKIPYFSEWGGVIAAFYMPFFFLLSGIFFNATNIQKRTMRLLKPFVFFFFLAFGVDAILSLLGHHPIEWKRLLEPISGTCPFRTNPPLWFLQALLMQVAIGAIVIKIPSKAVIVILSLLMGFIGYYLGTICHFNDYYLSSAFLTFPFFIAGNLIRSELLTTRRYWVYVTTMIVAILTFVITSSDNRVNVSLARVPCGWIPFLVIASTASYSLVGFCKNLDRIKYLNNAMRYYGKNSLTVLCTHIIIIFIPNYLANFNPFDSISVLFVFLFIIIAEIPIIEFSNRYLHSIVGNN